MSEHCQICGGFPSNWADADPELRCDCLEQSQALRSRVEQLTEVLREVLADPFGLPEGRVEKLRALLEER